MNTTTSLHNEIVDALADDGDTFELPDGRKLRLKVEPDDITFDSLDEMGDCYGATAWVQRSRDFIYDEPRPAGFDGCAEKLHLPSGGRVWWQPDPNGGAESRYKDPEGFKAFRQQVIDILEYGFRGYIIEVLDGEDAYARPIVREVASIWSVEPFADRGYVRSLVSDLLAELEVS